MARPKLALTGIVSSPVDDSWYILHPRHETRDIVMSEAHRGIGDAESFVVPEGEAGQKQMAHRRRRRPIAAGVAASNMTAVESRAASHDEMVKIL